MKNLIFVVFSLLLVSNISAQKKADVTFEVGGVCGMCEERIELAYDVKGIVIADYDLESHPRHSGCSSYRGECGARYRFD